MAYLLNQIVWAITSKCNMKCIHCGSDCKTEEKNQDLTTEECIKILEDIRDLGGCNHLVLSGGEPLLREDIGVITSMADLMDIKTSVISNAFKVDETLVKKIKEMHLVAFGISIDAADSYLHDYIRGIPGTFNHLENAIKLFKGNDIVPTIVTTVHKLNYSQLPKIRDFLIKNNVRLWQIQYGDNIGRMPKECQLTEAQYKAVADFIAETQTKYKNHFLKVSGADVFGYMTDHKVCNPYWFGCQAGISALGIDADGSVRGCLSMQDDKYIENNVRNRSLKDIWQDKNSFAYNRCFDCSTLTGYCKTCTYAAICKGGCYRASSIHGGRETPYCLYKIDKEGFSSAEQARTEFSKEEIFELYNPIRPLPPEFFELWEPAL